jgi:undecaprenyl-diphosphatase
MIAFLDNLDKQLFLFFNGLNAPWLDTFMYYATRTEFWIPLYILMVYVLYRNFGAEIWTVLLAATLIITLSDQVTSSLLKPLIERYRPSWSPDLDGLVHHVNGYKGGKFGFPSSHAANTFGTATLMVLTCRPRKWMYAFFLWAAFVSYTRIYLGVHYPGDIIVGALIGCFFGWLCSSLALALSRYVVKKKASPEN